MADNLYDHITPKIWCPISPDLNPQDYSVRSVVEIGFNEYPYNTKDSLKATMIQIISDVNKEQIIRACNWFRPRIEAVIDASGGFIE